MSLKGSNEHDRKPNRKGSGKSNLNGAMVILVIGLFLVLMGTAFAGASDGADPNGTVNETVTPTAEVTDVETTPVPEVTETEATPTPDVTETGIITALALEVTDSTPVFNPDTGNFPERDTRVTPAEREEAAERFKAVYEPIRSASEGGISLEAVMDPGGIPHYYGPIPNYANSPMPKGPIAAVTVDAGGSGYSGNTTVTIWDVYETGTGANISATIGGGGVITGFTINNPGSNYTAPRVTIIDPDATGNGAAASAIITPDGASGIRKFVHAMPGLDVANQNELGQYIPVAIPDTTTFPPGGRGYVSAPSVIITDINGTGAAATATVSGGEVTSVTVTSGGSGYSENPVVTFSGGGAVTNAIGKATVVNGEITAIGLIGCDYYVIELGQFTEQLHPDLPATTLRGYRQTNTADPDVSQFHYLGPLIVSQTDRPVRIRFENNLPVGDAGDLFIPVDKTVMGAGMGPLEMDVTNGYDINYTENRATIHLHGGVTPWISDGTPHQWTTPVNELTDYPRGVSVYNVPDMPDGGPNPPQGVLTFYYTNQQSARLMFFHDHAHGITRLNVYAGEAAGYIVQDQVEYDMIDGTNISGVNPGGLQVLPDIGIPLMIQDKSFVDADTLATQDPTWNAGSTHDGTPHTGDLWYPHVYMPVQNPADPSGINAFGRWQYGPWFWPPTQVAFGPIPNPYYGENPWEYIEIPGTSNPSMAMEAFMDTPMVNGAVYPYLEVEPRAYRFRVLSIADDRFFNLQFYVANESDVKNNGFATEVSMVPADFNPGYPPDWPTDGRAGGVPDPATRGPDWIQIGTEGGFLPKPVLVPNLPVGWNGDPTTFNAGNVNQHSLLLAPAERADVVVNFSGFAGQTLILYNDAPAAFPALDPHYDYYTGHPDLTDTGGTPTTYPGYGPNTRTIMQIRVKSTIGTPTPEVNLQNLEAVFAKTISKRGVFEVSQEPIIVPSSEYNSAYNDNFPADPFVRIYQTSHTFMNLSHGMMTMPLEPLAIQDEQGEAYDEYGRMSGFLGRQYRNPQGQQNLLLYGYESPPLEILKDAQWAKQITTLNDGTQIWKITHNGVDTHPIHWHLFNIQLINHVAWDNTVRPPDQNELGWKETLRVDPLEDTIVAMKAVVPTLPFEVPNSYRPLDPTMPIGRPMRSSPGGGNAWFDPTGQPVQVLNHIINFGGEYVFHCHILAHEEMDMMHPMLVAHAPNAPSNLALAVNGSFYDLTWTDNSIDETGFTLQRANDAGFTTGLVTFKAGVGATKFTDTTVVPGQVYYYRVQANNVVGDTTVYPAPAIGFPTMSADSAWSNKATTLASKIGIYSNGNWYLDYNGNGSYDTGEYVAFGVSGWTRVTGDWNGDGKTEIGIFKDGFWILDWDGTGVLNNNTRYYAFGASGWTPIVGDWNADFKDEIGVFQDGNWYLDYDGDGVWSIGDKYYAYGVAGWSPVVGKWKGDARTKIGIYSNGNWYLDYNGNGLYDAGEYVPFGVSGWTGVTGDWNGDGYKEIGIFDDGFWILDWDGNGVLNSNTRYYAFGASGWTPIVGDWNGDFKDEIGIYQSGNWYLDFDGTGAWTPGDKYYAYGTGGWTETIGKWR